MSLEKPKSLQIDRLSREYDHGIPFQRNRKTPGKASEGTGHASNGLRVGCLPRFGGLGPRRGRRRTGALKGVTEPSGEDFVRFCQPTDGGLNIKQC